jgi:hypothetical protein
LSVNTEVDFSPGYGVGACADALIVGMYQQFGDQLREYAGLVRELCAAPSSK